MATKKRGAWQGRTVKGKGANLSPPFAVSQASYVMWDCESSPPFPYHPVPVARPLSAKEMKELAHQVIEMAGEKLEDHPEPLKMLRNDTKSFVLVLLSRMKLLAGSGGDRNISYG
ncbi:MAG: hypothetical protein ABIS50_01580 [Luteolibacter sp.]|uniref:hypothetical protein n=1 Tax=Luteolibacter sp. TaxID=1962973 RepID=UPI0032672183